MWAFRGKVKPGQQDQNRKRRATSADFFHRLQSSVSGH
jgi:hypothetical protein